MQYEILIKSFLRPVCVKRLIDSIKTFYPDITIRVCDDGDLQHIPYGHLYKLPFYSGLAVGKNFLVSKVETPYFIMMDDDFIVTKDTDLHKLFKVILNDDEKAIVAGRIRENGVLKKGMGHLEVTYTEEKGRKLTRFYYGKNAPKASVGNIKFVPCRMTSQFIMGNKLLFDKYNIHWRDEMKRCEHYPFFLDLPPQVRCCCVPDVIIDHKPDRPEAYKRYRENNLYHKMVGERKLVFKDLYE